MQAVSSWTPPRGTLGELTAAAHQRARALRPRTAELERAARDRAATPSFLDALGGPALAVIAEVKRRSPSKGDIAPGLTAAGQGARYVAGGAAALSILTEPHRFGGSSADLVEARSALGVPLLKKDFHVDVVQLLEGAALGASAILLIARALAPDALVSLAAEARHLGLEPLIEIRDEAELDAALRADARVIGVNNRDLETLVIDPATCLRIVPLIPADRVAVAESGMSTVEDVRRYAAAGADAVLVGSSVSAAPDPAAAVRALTGVARSARG